MLNLNPKTPLVLSEEQKNIIKKFGVLNVSHWRKNEKKLRIKIRKDLRLMQNGLCVYCGCKVDLPGDVEHIAHKAKYTEFMFTPLNLAYSCKTCNQVLKGSEDVISTKKPDYNECEFNIVHPYFDDVDDYFDTRYSWIKINKSLAGDDLKKARRTFDLFQWESNNVVFRRAQWFSLCKRAKEHGMTPEEYAWAVDIENVSSYRPG